MPVMTKAAARVALAVTWLVCTAAGAAAQTDFHWNGPVASGQTIEIKGVNGAIHAVPATSGEAEVTAVKSARRSNPADVRIQVVPHPGGVTICAVYPDVPGEEPNRCEAGPNSHSHTRDNDTTVAFDVHVPAGVTFVGRTVNGSIDGESLTGDVDGHTVNGSVRLSTTGRAMANTVNGSIDVRAGRGDWPADARFSTVNGRITLTLPPSLNANMHASVVNGSISSDFPITVIGQISRRRLEGTIGSGGGELRLSTVNGSITLHKGQ